MVVKAAVKSKKKTKAKRTAVSNPPLFQVVLLNDDYTPMEFVVKLLIEIFAMTHTKATHVMMQIHHEGKGVCGIYTRDIAETKVMQVISCARSYGHPLMCQMEKI
ncbi:MAG: ATP-dependent Clp protease adapter ClpS [Gammaproteobacteria bacterium]|jgi:ATP-dependent Clp protease adaptor protein ClpS|nr:ATP-dependent Clp protease adapter ClpS [Gammaproteobacteria bacterium]